MAAQDTAGQVMVTNGTSTVATTEYSSSSGGYSAGAQNQANAQATKSGNSYTIKGTATGINSPDQQQALSKSFEMDVTCP